MVEKIVISGLGVIFSGVHDQNDMWHTLRHTQVNCQNKSADFFDPHPPSPLFSVEQDDLLSLCQDRFVQHLNRELLPGANRTVLLALKAINEALDQAGLSLADLKDKKVGIALGTTVGCTFHNEEYYQEWKKGKIRNHDPVFTYLRTNLSDSIQKILTVNGPRAVVTNACASGADAIGLAKSWLESKYCDIAIAGGSDEISRIACHGFSSLMLFSQSPCTPFDRNRTGLNLGEGAGIFVLEREKSLQQRNRKALGTLLGYGAASDAYHPTAPHPEGRGLQKAITAACQQGNLSPDSIGYINCHGTGTRANDLAELTAIFKAGYETSSTPPIASTKGVTGHTLGAAGAIEAVITLTSLLKKKAVGTIGCKNPDPSLPLQVLKEGESTSLSSSIAMSTSLAFGGGNATLIVEAKES